jgi:hypothetical protein
MKRCSFIVLLGLVTLPLGRAQPIPGPDKTLDLHTHAEWRVAAQVRFDPTGRLLILYRDNSMLRPNGNWHLIRLTEPLSEKPRREEITFSIPQEPEGPRPADRWILFYSDLLLSLDGSRAFATFNGSVVTPGAGPAPAAAKRNVKVDPFSSVVSFDLEPFRLHASANIVPRPGSNPGQIDAKGNLLLLYSTEDEWRIEAMDENLQVVAAVTVSMGPVAKTQRSSCRFRADFKVECPAYGGGTLVLGPESTVQLAQSGCKMDRALTPQGPGKDEMLNGRLGRSDHLCLLSESGQEGLVSPDLFPRCGSGWQPAAMSTDRRSLLTSCLEEDQLFDIFFHRSKATLQIVDALTLHPRATIPLSTRPRLAYTIFHRSGTTTVAVLEDGNKLRLYSLAD